MKNIYLTILFAVPLFGHTQILVPGDIAIIGFAADTGSTVSYDEFSWLPLVNLDAGTKIYFTDAGYNSADGDFMGLGLNDEILLKYTVPSGGIAAGTVFTLTEEFLPPNYTVISGTKFGSDFNGSLSFPNAGDQITIFQSTDDETVPSTFGSNFTAIFMATASTLSFPSLTVGKALITPASDVDNVTNLAPGLTEGVNAIAVGSGPLQADESDNARYVGITTGTREQLLASICLLSNWTRYDAAFGNDITIGTAPNGWSANGVSMFTVTTLSAEDLETASITLFPNPTNGKLYVNNIAGNQIGSVTVLNELGQRIYSSPKFNGEIDLTDFSSGLYLVQLEFDQSIVTCRIIKN